MDSECQKTFRERMHRFETRAHARVTQRERRFKNICLWAAISAKSHPVESAVSGERRGKVFGQPGAGEWWLPIANFRDATWP